MSDHDAACRDLRNYFARRFGKDCLGMDHAAKLLKELEHIGKLNPELEAMRGDLADIVMCGVGTGY